jgi:hypothetical protein
MEEFVGVGEDIILLDHGVVRVDGRLSLCIGSFGDWHASVAAAHLNGDKNALRAHRAFCCVPSSE